MTSDQIPEAAVTAAADVLFAAMFTVLPEPMSGRDLAVYQARHVLAAAAPVIAAVERERLAGLARRILAGDARAFTELATILDDALECGS